ncbi:AAA family ATPase [Streptomyces sp. NA02950]|uniref:helix-turn-helix transcriptional regulator n=1 Tax=Streptomyces sp. NA02950 TaxID=2742137 RepID=UPI00158FB42B|nr:helix-turn-helix transcriptional regulator [Streptomyces sp. NA02950]QKV90549.1 AAA family ATPase [Streptomyces sp. NA02950]
MPVNLSERGEELRLLEKLYTGCEQGKGAVVLAHGPVACGKTALIRCFADWATERGGRFLSMTASASEQLDRLGLVDQLLSAMRAVGTVADPLADADEVLPGSGRVPLAVLQRICRTVTEFAREQTLVLGVDDVHFADEASLECLSYLIRRIDASAILVLLAESSCHERELRTLHAETLHLPYCHRIRLGTLGVDGVAGQLAAHPVTGSAAGETAKLWAETSGGNPLLLHALIEDAEDAPYAEELSERAEADARDTPPTGPYSAASHAPLPGESFRHAYLRCLHRCEPAMSATARAIAVLGESVGPALIGDFLGDDVTSVRRSIAELNAAGLLSGNRFRHERARLAVLADIPARDLFAMRARAAELLHESGAPAAAVADQLMATHESLKAPWHPHILREAAREAIDAGDIDAGITYLRHAASVCVDATQRAGATAALAQAQWLVDPVKSARHLAQLSRMVRAGLLTGPDALAVVGQHAWLGELAQADALLRTIEARAATERSEAWDGAGTPPDAVHSDLDLARLWLSFCRPGPRRDTGEAAPGARAGTPGARAPGSMSPRTFLTLATGLNGDDECDRMAYRVLRGARTSSTFEATLCALVLLIECYRLDEAVAWSERLLEEPWNRRVPMRRALLETIRAAAALRSGDLKVAGEAAQAALGLAAPEAWGIALGLPLSLAARAGTELGDVDTAMSYLNLPVPMVMFDTPFALPYLHALGRYHLAIGRPRTALRNLRSCGELMREWRLDVPELVDWRNDAAAALLALGENRRARALLEEHLSLLGEQTTRARGVALRLLAAAGPPQGRLERLQEAIRILRACGDRLELGRAMADAETARSAAEQGSAPAEPPRPQTSPWTYVEHARDHSGPAWPEEPEPRGTLPEDPASGAPEVPESLTELTEAERRVGAFAAYGCTNREIAGRLFITVSTVEQHLTKIYKKLHVRSRAELPESLIRFADVPCSPNGR